MFQKRSIYFLLIVLFVESSYAYGQKYPTKEIRVTYANGVNVFNICITNPSINFDEKKEYSWYSENSGSSEIKITEGGAGGNLLHGIERFFDKKGNLSFERHYNLGLLHGEAKYWDSATNKLNDTYKFENGILTKKKVKVKGGWFEESGSFYTNGYTRKWFNEINVLTKESVFKNDNYYTKDYYNYTSKIKAEYSTTFWCDTCMTGKYTLYYQNGNKKIEGQYDDTLDDVKIGTWKWYNETGGLEAQELYKSELQKWPNGEWKVTGANYYDSSLKKWVKIGLWHWYDEKGKLYDIKRFDNDIEIKP